MQRISKMHVETTAALMTLNEDEHSRSFLFSSVLNQFTHSRVETRWHEFFQTYKTVVTICVVLTRVNHNV